MGKTVISFGSRKLLQYCVILLNLTQGSMGKIQNIADIKNVQVFGENRPDQRVYCKVS